MSGMNMSGKLKLYIFGVCASLQLALYLGYRCGGDDAPEVAATTPATNAPAKPRSAPPITAATSGEPKLRVGQAQLRRLVPVIPNQGALIAVGETMDVQGLPMAVATYETTQDPVEILTFYGRYFEKQGWARSASVQDSLTLLKTPGLSATIPDELLQVSVLVEDDPQSGVRTVVLGLADVAALAMRTKGPPEAADFPVYPGAKPAVVTVRDEGSNSITVSFDTTDAPEKVLAFLEQELGHRGYHKVADPGIDSIIRYEAPGRRWDLAVVSNSKLTAVSAQTQRAAGPMGGP